MENLLGLLGKPKLFKILEDEAPMSRMNVVLCSRFSKDRDNLADKSRELKLFNTMIVMAKAGSETLKSAEINFDLSFEIMRDADKTEGQEEYRKIGKPVGIRFKSEQFQVMELFSDNPLELERWEQELGRRMNQRGFHELFRAMKRVGKGNFASVYLGERLKDGKQFAIKAFAKEATYSQQNGKAGIINEIKINRMFDHPNLMKMEGVFQSDNSLYIVLEYIGGQQLYNKLQVKYKFSENEVRYTMRGLLQGVAEMARHNVIHRDLKPQNIMYREDGKEAVIVDFGLATKADEKHYLFVRCGTPGYVAPEIINIKDMNSKSHPIADVFSLGCIFYHLILGKNLFPGRNFNEVLLQNRECDFVLDGPEFDNIPYATADLLRRMLQKQPELRITAAQALRHPYFVENMKPVYTPKIKFKESPSCPTDLVGQNNEPNFKLIVKEPRDNNSNSTDDKNIKELGKQLNGVRIVTPDKVIINGHPKPQGQQWN